MGERHLAMTAGQISHERAASYDRSNFASVNHGRPGIAAMNTINGQRFDQQGHTASGNGFRPFGAGAARNDAVAQHGSNQTGWRQFSQQHSAQGFRSAQQGFQSNQASRSEATRTEGRAQNTNRQAAAGRANGGKANQRQGRNAKEQKTRSKRQNDKAKRNGGDSGR